jgi:dihydropteroate synthase
VKKSMPFSVTAEPSQPPDVSFLFHSKRAWLMGILNITPDSFYAGARTPRASSALETAQHMIAEGADILDIGGESTRPGASPVSVQEELARVVPVVDALRSQWPAMPLSVDTQKAAVAQATLSHGASVINDISALRHDPDMAAVIAQAHCPVVLMHMQGIPQSMQTNPTYENVVTDVKRFFEERLSAASRAGIHHDQIILDPGIGFGKTTLHNLTLLKHLAEFLPFGCPLLVGVSRKSFIGRLLGTPESPLPVEERLEGSLAANLWAVLKGARGLRVHDVGATRQALQLWESVAAV